MIISHNILAMNASRNLGLTEKDLQNSTRRLSSGYRITMAADDAAGLAISEKMRAQIRGLKRASENAQDGISLLQVADGALGEVQAMLHRMRELCVQGASDINTEEDRDAIQAEINELTEEIDHVSKATEFNKKTLLDGSWAGSGSSSKKPIYFMMEHGKGGVRLENSVESLNGEKAGERVTLQEAMGSEGLNIIYTEIENDFATTQTASGKPTAAGYENFKKSLEEQIVPQAVKALLTAFPDTFNYLNSSSIGIGLKLVNQPGSATLASVGIGYLTYSDGTLVKDQFSYTLTVNMGYLDMDVSGNIASDPASSKGREALETTIVHEMMHALMDEALTNGMIGAQDGKKNPAFRFPGWFVEGMAQTAAGGCSPYNDWVNGGLGLTAGSTEASISATVKSSANSLKSGSTASQYGTGYLACMYLGFLASGSGAVNENSIASGLDKIMNEMKNGKSLDDVIREHTSYAGVSDFEKNFGDSASSAFIKELVTKVGAGSGGLVGGSFASTDLLPDTAHNTNLFKLNTQNETVMNTYPTGVDKLTDGGSGGGTRGGGSGDGLWFQTGANDGQGIRVYIDDMGADALGIRGLSVADHEAAGDSMNVLDDALKEVSRQRSVIGASHNRLEYTVRNADNSVENLQAAESRLRDLDMAEEMTKYSKSQILLQAGQSMLAQAAHAPENILQLLG